jgi:hypothetical protein
MIDAFDTSKLESDVGQYKQPNMSLTSFYESNTIFSGKSLPDEIRT